MKFIEKKPSSHPVFFEKDEEKNTEATNGCQRRAFRLSELEAEPSRKTVVKRVPQEGQDCSFSKEKGQNRPQKAGKREEKDAFRAALPILSSGANSTRMLRDKLIKKGYSAAEARLAAEEAHEAGLLNDRRLLEAYAYSLATRKYYGKGRIRLILQQKFDRDVVERYFEEALEDIDFYALAVELARRFWPRGREYVIGKLKRAGYSVYEIRRALEALGAQNAEEADENEE